ncbi:MAG: hypothetical protein LBT59_27320 [Clostridiales bacterium]|nr:hypothetical protein [Clostridiales bacterium]
MEEQDPWQGLGAGFGARARSMARIGVLDWGQRARSMARIGARDLKRIMYVRLLVK